MLIAPLAIPMLALLAHDWYPQQCCSGHDCQPVPDTSIEASQGGWIVKDTGEVVPYSRTQTSPDGKVHRCWSHNPRVPLGMSHTICLFVPPPAT